MKRDAAADSAKWIGARLGAFRVAAGDGVQKRSARAASVDRVGKGRARRIAGVGVSRRFQADGEVLKSHVTSPVAARFISFQPSRPALR